MKKFDLFVWGNDLLWEGEDGYLYGGFDPASVRISVIGEGINDEEINMDNVYFKNIGYVDIDVDIINDEYIESDCTDKFEIEFTDKEEEESQQYWDEDEPSEYEGENQTLSYIEASIDVHYGKARFNGVSTGINIVKKIYFNDKIILE